MEYFFIFLMLNKRKTGKTGETYPLNIANLHFSLPKMNMADMLKGPIDLSEVQDFSMSKKPNMNTSAAAAFGGKGKLDDMLSKLMKKNNTLVSIFFFIFSAIYSVHHYHFGLINAHSHHCHQLRSQFLAAKKNAAVSWMKLYSDCRPRKSRRHFRIHCCRRAARKHKSHHRCQLLPPVAHRQDQIANRIKNRSLLP